MPKFTKKPIAIEAVRYLGIEMGKPHFANAEGLVAQQDTYTIHDERCPEWLQVAMAKGGTSESGVYVRSLGGESWGGSQQLELFVKTLEGEMHAQPGDWIICGVAGEVYPCKPDIFAASYDLTEEPN